MPVLLATARRTAVLATVAAFAACSDAATAPAAPRVGAPRAAYLPPAEGAGVDSVTVDPTPVPLQNGAAVVPVTAHTTPGSDGVVVVFDCGGTVVSAVAGGGVATAACPFGAPGVTPVTAAVEGGTPVPSSSYAVVYDPGSGFVTGGGWIVSPPGALAAAPALSARASFGFVAKYLPGRQTPDGETEFQFRAAGFNFHGGVYQWLVVSGARAQYRGTGRVNNAGRYDFVVTAIDGDRIARGTPDRFRIRITDAATGEVVYDNHRDAPEVNADASTQLSGGAISIKR